MSSLSTNLFSELSPRFFGVLTSPNARIYVDVIDLIERELPARGDSLERAEVLELIDQVLTQGIAFHPDDEEEVQEDETHPQKRGHFRGPISAGMKGCPALSKPELNLALRNLRGRYAGAIAPCSSSESERG